MTDVELLERALSLAHAGAPLRGIDGLTDPDTRLLVSLGLVVGAPLTGVLERCRDVAMDRESADLEVMTSLAGPRLARRTVMSMPAVAVLLGVLLGFDPLSVLVFTPVGWICMALGGALMWWGHRWMSRLERVARAHPAHAGTVAEAMALGMSAGLPPTVAVRLVRSSAFEASDTIEADMSDMSEAVARAAALGVAVVPELRRRASDLRRIVHQARLRAARELGERILIPLGVCFLPAFLLWAVVPVAYGMMRGVAL